MNQGIDCRTSIVQALHLLSSPDAQLAYEHDVPAVNVLDEVVATWFDDTYLPDAEPFKEFFSGAELKAMAKFSRYFEERINHLPPTASGVGVWLKDENWQRIMQEARDLLVALQAG